MDQPIIQPVILSGGAGSRLWPLSKPDSPKQLLTLIGQHSLLQTTLLRVADASLFASPLIIANHTHRFETAQQLEEIEVNGASIVLEPCGRNTAAAIATACLLSKPNALLLALPADHYIDSDTRFIDAVRTAMPLAQQGKIVTFGIRPTRAETGYGYIAKGDAVEGGHTIQHFTEKPDQATAEAYLAAGDYAWNSGMFLFIRDAMLNALSEHAPAIVNACEKAIAGAVQDTDFTRLDETAFAACESISIDHAVMEHTQNAAVVGLECGWSDIGSWPALISLLSNESEQEYRPWGWYRNLLTADQRNVKELNVNPGLRMSLQRHAKRSEQWLVLEGQAEITCDDKVHLLSEGESFFVPKGAWHRLGNPLAQPLRLIEVQEGVYLGEDDIERKEDDFGRT